MENKAKPKVPEVMERSFNIDELTVRFGRWFPKLSAQAVSQLGNFYLEIVRSNSAVNLVSASSIRSVDSTHLADCVLAAQALLPQLLPNYPIYDLASGGGLPGVVMAIVDPNWPVRLVDRDVRKVAFLRDLLVKLEIKNVTVEHIDVEKIADRSIHNAVCRDFASLAKTMLSFRKPMSPGGRLFHLKSDGWSQELASVPTQLFSVWETSLVGQYALPESGTMMAVVLSEKKID